MAEVSIDRSLSFQCFLINCWNNPIEVPVVFKESPFVTVVSGIFVRLLNLKRQALLGCYRVTVRLSHDISVLSMKQALLLFLDLLSTINVQQSLFLKEKHCIEVFINKCH